MMIQSYYILNDYKRTIAVSVDKYWRWVSQDRDFFARRVGENFVEEIRISTVFLGMDHQWGNGPPLLFETMTFGPPGYEERCERCSTYSQALTQHSLMVGKIRQELGYQEEKKPFRLIEV